MKKKLENLIQFDAVTVIILIASFLAALYFAAISDSAMSGGDTPWNPFSAISYIVHNGVPGTTVIMLFVLFSAVGLYLRKNGIGFSDSRLDERNFKYSESGVYGTSGFLQSSELEGVAMITDAEDAYGTILGQLDKTGNRIVSTDVDSYELNKHVTICGGSGAGKSRSYARPFLIQAAKRRESLVVTDPKGELYEDTSEYMREHGYEARIFNIKNPLKSDSWNCLRELIGSDYKSQIFSSVVIENTSPPKDIWKEAKASLFKALCLRVARGSDYGTEDGCKGPKTMEEVYKLITMGSDEVDKLFDETELAKVGAMSAYQPYQIYLKNSTNSKAAIVASLGNALQAFQGREVCEMTAIDDIDLTLPAQKPCVYYCVMPDQHSTMNFFASLFFSFLFIDLIDYIDDVGPENCIPINFLLDEFPNIGSIPDFDQKIATVRSRNINISIIIQGLPQLQQRYPDGKWSTIIGNCDTVLFLGTGFDQLTADFISKRTGEATVKVKTEQHGKIDPLVKVGFKHSTGDGKRVLMTDDEVLRLDRDKCIIIFSRKKIMKAFKYDFTLHPEAKKFKKCRIRDIPDIFDTEARHELRERDNKRIQEYEEYLKANPSRTKNARTKAPVNSPSMLKNIISNLISTIKDYREKRSWKVVEKPAGLIDEAGRHTTMIRQDNSEDVFPHFQQATNNRKANIEIIDGVIYDKDTHRRVGYLDGNTICYEDDEPADDEELLEGEFVDTTDYEELKPTKTETHIPVHEPTVPHSKERENDGDSDQGVPNPCNVSDGAVSISYDQAESNNTYGNFYSYGDGPEGLGDDFMPPELPVDEDSSFSEHKMTEESHATQVDDEPVSNVESQDTATSLPKMTRAKTESQYKQNANTNGGCRKNERAESSKPAAYGCAFDAMLVSEGNTDVNIPDSTDKNNSDEGVIPISRPASSYRQPPRRKQHPATTKDIEQIMMEVQNKAPTKRPG